MNRKIKVGGTVYKGFAKANQRVVERMERLPGADSVQIGLSKVLAVYPDRMACDIQTPNGMTRTNVPILTRCGLEADEVWGELELPSVDSYVLVGFVEGRESFPVILGTLYPYAFSKYQKGQTTVNSGSKAFTLKILEDVDPKVYRKVFKSGTTIEVAEDGTLTIETPSGRYIMLDEANGEMKIEDADGNIFTISSSGVVIEDANGNDITMASGKVTINGNLEVAQ